MLFCIVISLYLYIAGKTLGWARSGRPPSACRSRGRRRWLCLRRTRRHQTCDFRERSTSAPAELGGTIHNVPSPYAGPSAGAEVARFRKWPVLVPPGLFERRGPRCSSPRWPCKPAPPGTRAETPAAPAAVARGGRALGAREYYVLDVVFVSLSSSSVHIMLFVLGARE